MAWFFTNPILSRIEDALWKKAEAEVSARVESGQLSPDNLKREVKTNFDAIFSKQRQYAKLALKTYKQIAESKATEALALALANSQPDWYSIENAWSTGVPVILAVPLRLVRGQVAHRIASLLPSRIEFADLVPEAQAEFAKEAAATYFMSDITRAIKSRTTFKAEAFYPYDLRIAELVARDHYYMGDSPNTTREDMLVLNTTATKDFWEDEYKKDPGKRPQSRRYTATSESKWKSLP